MHSQQNSDFKELREKNEALKAGYPPIPEGARSYLDQFGKLPNVLSELPADPSLSAKQATELGNRLGKHPTDVQEFMKDLAVFLDGFPYRKELKQLWCNSDGYWDHGPRVLDAMNSLLEDRLDKVLTGESGESLTAHVRDLRIVVSRVELMFEGRDPDDRSLRTEKAGRLQSWDRDGFHGLLRLGALYHDIGKYIIKERHPTIGWYVAEYIDPKEKAHLRQVLAERDEYFQLLLTIIRDHDQFGVLSTGEASYPILLRAARPVLSTLQPQHVLSALMMCNLADMVGTFRVDGQAVDRLVHDWEWMLRALKECELSGANLDELVFKQASEVTSVSERIWRLLVEASRRFPERKKELGNKDLVTNALRMVFGNDPALSQFARQFTRICKLDYGKKFFEALIEYCEGPRNPKIGRLPLRSSLERPEDVENVVYAALSILKRITTTYGAMLESGPGMGNLIGVEMKDLTPESAPEKTARIIDLIVRQHYPGLTWMMSDVPAWFF